MTASMFDGTTICAVRKEGKSAVAGDGQITFGEKTIMKGNAKKVRRLYHGNVVVGFAGGVSDALTLCEKFEEYLTQYTGNLPRAAVELAQNWRMDKGMRQLQAMMLAADSENMLLISGTGEVIEPDESVCAIGSGGSYALASAKALIRHTDMTAEQIAVESLKIAASICVFTNESITCEIV